jgi:hypothetical protein
VGAALASHGRSHRFDPCHAHQHKHLPGILLRHLLPADCQQTTSSGRASAKALPSFGTLRTSLPAGEEHRSAQWSGGIRTQRHAASPSEVVAVDLFDLRLSFTDRDRSCPPTTSGSWCRADPSRTRATVDSGPVLSRRLCPKMTQLDTCSDRSKVRQSSRSWCIGSSSCKGGVP